MSGRVTVKESRPDEKCGDIMLYLGGGGGQPVPQCMRRHEDGGTILTSIFHVLLARMIKFTLTTTGPAPNPC